MSKENEMCTLTEQELRERRGMPVWVTDYNGFESWAIVTIDKIGQYKDIIYLSGVYYSKDKYGDVGVKFQWDYSSRNLECYDRPCNR